MASSRHETLPDVTISIIGLGPAGLEYLNAAALRKLEEADVVIVRTARHPAASELGETRKVVSCDDLYDTRAEFDDVYSAIADRVLAAAGQGSVVYGVPGSASVGERAVPQIARRAAAADITVTVHPGLSFLDLVYVAVGLDPIADGLQVLDARDLPDPLPLHLPTIITQLDSKLVLSEVSITLMRTVSPATQVTIVDRLGDLDEVIELMAVNEIANYDAGPRTTLFVPETVSGLLGLIATNRVLRRECPWDAKQTHHTLLTHLIEEAYETADAIGQLPHDAPGGSPDYGAYAEVEEELGDLLLQVIFHSVLASEAGAFDIDEVAEQVRRKLVHRHPHVFGDVTADTADEVLSNWEQIKKAEKNRDSLMDDIPTGMPAVARAMKVQKRARSVGFDWDDPEQVIRVLRHEIDELVSAGQDADAAADELGDVLFTAVNLARKLGVDPEVALRATVDKFIRRFRAMEDHFTDQGSDISDATSAELELAWESAKSVVG